MSTGQPIRLGNEHVKADDVVNINYDQDVMIHVKASASSTHPADYAAVCGQNDKSDPTPGRAEYCDDTLEIYVHAGWMYARGSWPRGRTKRIKVVGPGTTIMVRLKPIEDAGADPEDSVDHQAYLLNPMAGQKLQLWLESASPPFFCPPPAPFRTIECKLNPPADTADTYYVSPGQEAYLTVDPYDAVTVTKEPGTAPTFAWTGDDQALIDDNIKVRVARILK